MFTDLKAVHFIVVGLSFGLGLINLITGSRKEAHRVFLIFGIIALAVAGYFSSSYVLEGIFTDTVKGKITLFFAHVFYGLFPWFVLYFTGYRRAGVWMCWSISGVTLLSYLLFLLTPAVISDSRVWYNVSHLVLFGVGIHGILAALHMIKNNKVGLSEGRSFLVSIVAYNVLMIEELLQAHLNITGLLPSSYANFPVLDFFPILFMVLMGTRIARDANKRVMLEKALSLREQQWQAFLENVTLLVTRIDREGSLTYVNPYFEQFSGYTANEVLGKNWFSLMYSESFRPRARKFFKEIIAGKTKMPSEPSPVRLKSGETRIISWSRVPYYGAPGKITGFIQIGSDSTDMEVAIKKVEELKLRLEKESLKLNKGNRRKDAQSKIIGQSETLEYTLNRAYQVAPSDASVLLEGETGVGKELFAELIHEKSKRSHKPFVRVNCAGLPKDLIESELFGHEKGAFTGAVTQRKGRFELANGGTLFLDEIGEFPMELQAKLLRVLQQGEFERIGGQKTIKVNVRIISATNRNLFKEIKNGNFREDLYYRLNVYPITIPPLRQRKADIPALIRFFVDRLSKKNGKTISEISKKDMQELVDYDWPGNVRELENLIERAIIATNGSTLNLEGAAGKAYQPDNAQPVPVLLSLEEMEKAYIEKVLHSCDWKINGANGAAEKLRVHPSTLRSKMKKLKISRPEVTSE